MSRRLTAGGFYYPVRVTNLGERIRASRPICERTLAWLWGLGVISPCASSIRRFLAISSGPFAALGWPDAAPAWHQLISDALCAFFIVDDLCDSDASRRSPADGLDTMALFVDLKSVWSGADASAPSNDTRPLRRAFQDLRDRFVRARAPRAWMRRFSFRFDAWLDAVAKELGFKARGIVPDPLELMRIRPDAGASLLFMMFIELGRGIELGELLADARLIELQEIAGRVTIYPNDIFSYEKEHAHGHAMNLIAALMAHRRMTRPEAVECVLRMHNEETIRFEQLAMELTASEVASAEVKAYVLGLYHYMYGLFVWGLHAERYSRSFFRSSRELDSLLLAS